MELAEIILDWCSGENNSPRGLQNPEHGGCLVVGRLESVTYYLLSTCSDGSAHGLSTFISDDESDGWTNWNSLKKDKVTVR